MGDRLFASLPVSAQCLGGRAGDLRIFGPSAARHVWATDGPASPQVTAVSADQASRRWQCGEGTGPTNQAENLQVKSSEPPKGIEPLTYALRVRRSDRLS